MNLLLMWEKGLFTVRASDAHVHFANNGSLLFTLWTCLMQNNASIVSFRNAFSMYFYTWLHCHVPKKVLSIVTYKRLRTIHYTQPFVNFCESELNEINNYLPFYSNEYFVQKRANVLLYNSVHLTYNYIFISSLVNFILHKLKKKLKETFEVNKKTLS